MQMQRVIACLERAALHHGDEIKIVDGDLRMTYNEVSERIYRLANGLRSLGVYKGDAVAALCMNHHRYFEIIFACHALGAIIIPLNTRLKEDELIYILNDSKAKVLFIDDPFLPMLEKIRSGAGALDHVYFSDSGETPEGLKNYRELLEGQPPELAQVEIDEEDVMGYYYTGGTTGMPKGVMLTGRSLSSNAFHLESMMHYTSEDVYLHIGPMFHLADLASFYAVTMMGGAHIFGRAFEPKLTLELIQKHKVTMTILVPTMINFLLNYAEFDNYDMSSLRTYLYGASPMPVPLLKLALEKIPVLPTQGYGMTEGAPLVTVLRPEDHKKGSEDGNFAWLLKTAGRSVPGVEIKVVDDDDNEVPIGQAGEVAVRGPNMMKGYLNKPDETKEVLYNGWYHSGDVAVRNEGGFITIVDRKKDMIISGGENVYTTEVENAIMKAEGVLETTVIGIPDDKWGEVPHAFVVMKDGFEADEKAIIGVCRDSLAHFKCPKAVTFIDDLPKSGAGKILKRDLRKSFWGDRERQVQ